MAQENKNKLIRVWCVVVVAPTHKKAFLAAFRDSEGEVIGKTWLPYSRVKQVLRGDGGFTIEGVERGEEIEIEIPQWLAESDEVEPLIREQLLERDAEDEPDEKDSFDDDIPF